MNTELYINKLKDNPQNKIFISSPMAPSISAFVDADTDFGAAAEYNANEITQEIARGAADTINKGMEMSSMRMSSKNLSKLTWQHSTVNNLGFEIYFLSVKKGDNPLKEAVKIYKYLLPESAGTGIEYTPNQYRTSLPVSTSVTNACSILIGDWFQSINQWVMISGSFTVSKQKQMDGKTPLFVKVSVQFQPVQDFYASDATAWFKGI